MGGRLCGSPSPYPSLLFRLRLSKPHKPSDKRATNEEGVFYTWELLKLLGGQRPQCLFELKMQAVEMRWERI